jgi:hypothetical protein
MPKKKIKEDFESKDENIRIEHLLYSAVEIAIEKTKTIKFDQKFIEEFVHSDLSPRSSPQNPQESNAKVLLDFNSRSPS